MPAAAGEIGVADEWLRPLDLARGDGLEDARLPPQEVDGDLERARRERRLQGERVRVEGRHPAVRALSDRLRQRPVQARDHLVDRDRAALRDAQALLVRLGRIEAVIAREHDRQARPETRAQLAEKCGQLLVRAQRRVDPFPRERSELVSDRIDGGHGNREQVGGAVFAELQGADGGAGGAQRDGGACRRVADRAGQARVERALPDAMRE